MIKKVFAIMFVFLMMQTSIFALNIPKQDESIYVNDYSNVLSENIENELISINQISDDETGGYVVVATFDFVDEDLYDFSYRLFNEWGIGSSEYNNGILLVLDIGNDNYCYILGSGIERYLTDSEAWDIIDNYMEPDFAIKDYDQAVLKTTKQFLDVIEQHFIMEDEVIIDDSDQSLDIGALGLFGGIFSIFLFGFRFISSLLPIIIIIFVLVTIARSRRQYGPPQRPIHRPYFGPTNHRHHDPFAPRPNRDFNSRPHRSNFGGQTRGFGGTRSGSFGGSRPSSFGGSRSHHSGGSSRGAGGTRR